MNRASLLGNSRETAPFEIPVSRAILSTCQGQSKIWARAILPYGSVVWCSSVVPMRVDTFIFLTSVMAMTGYAAGPEMPAASPSPEPAATPFAEKTDQTPGSSPNAAPVPVNSLAPDMVTRLQIFLDSHAF